MKLGEQYGANLFTAITTIDLVHRDGQIDFWSTSGDVAVEVMVLTSESFREALTLDRDSSRLSRRWEFLVPVNRLGEETRRAPNRRILEELEEALVECERLGIWEPTQLELTVEPWAGLVWPEPQATVCRLLGGRAPGVTAMAFELPEVSPGISISPRHGGWSVPDPDGVAGELDSLIAAGHSLAKHIDKTQKAGADRQVLVLLPDSTWRAAWDLVPDRLGSGPLPTSRLDIAGPAPIEIWLVGDQGLVWVYNHPGGDWQQCQDPRQTGHG